MTAEVTGPTGLRRAGAVITGLFGLPWALTAAGFLTSGPATAVLLAAVAVTGLAVGVALLSANPRPERTRTVPVDWRRRFNAVGLAQAVAIGAAAAALVLGGQPTLIPAAVCLVVGLHFLPLTRLFDQAEFRWTGTGLCVVAVASVALHLLASTSAAVVAAGCGAAVVLWTTSLRVTLSG